MMLPYTYLIGWSKLDVWYYGARVANKNAPSEDLWKTYFTSSYYVKKFIEENGNPDVIEVRKTFENSEKCFNWERCVLKRLKVQNKENWLNKSISGSFFIDEDIKKKMSETQKGRKFSESHKRNMTISARNYWNTESGKQRRLELSHAMKNFKHSSISIEKIRKKASERKLSEEHKSKIIKHLRRKKPRKIIIKYDDGKVLNFMNVNEAANHINLSVSTLNKICASEKGYGVNSYSRKHKFTIERL